MIAAVLRGAMCGVGVLLAALPFASFDIAQPGWIVAFALIGGAFLASLG